MLAMQCRYKLPAYNLSLFCSFTSPTLSLAAKFSLADCESSFCTSLIAVRPLYNIFLPKLEKTTAQDMSIYQGSSSTTIETPFGLYHRSSSVLHTNFDSPQMRQRSSDPHPHVGGDRYVASLKHSAKGRQTSRHSLQMHPHSMNEAAISFCGT